MAESLAQLPDTLLTQSLLYALHTDDQLDIEAIAHTVRNQKKLTKLTMTAFEKIMAKGKAEGEAKGVWIGKIQIISEFLSKTSASVEILASLTEAELKEMFTDLQQRYDSDFKGN